MLSDLMFTDYQRNIFGESEIHLTVAAGDNFESLERWVKGKNYKFTHILLSQGVYKYQPMVTYKGTGFVADLERIEDNRKELADIGYAIIRRKIEVPPWNPCVPQFSFSRWLPKAYFEAHIKVLLHSKDESLLALVANDWDGKLSKNAFKKLEGDIQERFVTIRGYSGCKQFDDSATMLFNAIKSAKFEIIRDEREYVIYDSNFELDKGWI